MSSASKGKGKARDVSEHNVQERTPLLTASTSYSSTSRGNVESGPSSVIDEYSPPPRSMLSRILSVLAVCIMIAFFLLFIFLAFVWLTLRGAPASRQAPESIVSHATRWRTTSLDVTDASRGHIMVQVQGQLGVDTDWILGIDPHDSSAMTFARRVTGRWLVSVLGGFESTESTTFSVNSFHDDTFLLNVTAQVLEVAVKANSQAGRVRSSHVKIPLQINPSLNTTELSQFAEETWIRGAAHVKVSAAQMTVQPVRRPWWFPQVSKTVHNISTDLRIPRKCRLS